jgi:hypothetical protein
LSLSQYSIRSSTSRRSCSPTGQPWTRSQMELRNEALPALGRSRSLRRGMVVQFLTALIAAGSRTTGSAIRLRSVRMNPRQIHEAISENRCSGLQLQHVQGGCDTTYGTLLSSRSGSPGPSGSELLVALVIRKLGCIGKLWFCSY